MNPKIIILVALGALALLFYFIKGRGPNSIYTDKPAMLSPSGGEVFEIAGNPGGFSSKPKTMSPEQLDAARANLTRRRSMSVDDQIKEFGSVLGTGTA